MDERLRAGRTMCDGVITMGWSSGTPVLASAGSHYLLGLLLRLYEQADRGSTLRAQCLDAIDNFLKSGWARASEIDDMEFGSG